MNFSLNTLKRGLLLFWALWMTIVLLTNLADLGQHVGLGANWPFVSGNYALIAQTVAIYTLPESLALILFIGVIVWEAWSAFLLFRAFAAFHGAGSQQALYNAFAVSLALWAALVLADEIFIAYSYEGTHMGIFTSQLVTLLAVRLLPNEGR
jgi:hypothetical protein